MPDEGERPADSARGLPRQEGKQPQNLGDVTADHAPEPGAPRPIADPRGAVPVRDGADRAAPTNQFVPGAMIAARYRVVSLIGQGGMGEVYRAEDLRLGQSVAIKLLPRELEQDPRRLEQLHAEVRLAREVSHANVARVYDIGDADGRHFLTMEFVDGEDLASLLRRVGHPNNEKAIEIARQICAGLAALHDRGLLHRDLKPANIMLDGRGAVRIMDFGLARRVDQVGPAGRAGTPAYMAPEQWTGEALTRATDLYAVGLIFFELFTGRSAVSAQSIEDYRRWHTSASTETLSHSLTSIDPAVERVILKCLEKDPSQRPPSALAVAAMLPGGDPIAAALAAGDTPSPEMVAAAGRAARISPAFAFPVAALFLISLIVWILAPSPFRPWQFAALPKSPAVLLDRADAIAVSLGHAERAAGSGWGFVADRDAVQWLDRTAGTEKLTALREGRIDPLLFYARRSPRPLVALNAYERITPDDPPFDRSEMTLVKLDPLGRLRAIEVVPSRVLNASPDPSVPPAPESTPPSQRVSHEAWSQLFNEAGLTFAAFDTATPTRHPRFFADEVLAWTERVAEPGKPTRRVEAAALDGEITQFEVLGPWSETKSELSLLDASGPATEGRVYAEQVARAIGWIMAAIFFGLFALMIVLTIRHLRAGRGDLRGGNTTAIAVMVIAFLRWLLLCDPSLSPWFLNALLSQGVALSLFAAALAWLLYMALEPFTRRIWPSTMITWQRLLQGRLTDPLLGRDLLIGACAGVLILLVNSLGFAIEMRLGDVPKIDFGESWMTPWLYGLTGGRRVVGLLLLAVQTGVIGPMAFLLVMVLARVVLRRAWLAVIPLLVILGLSQALSSSSVTSGVIVGSLTAVIVVVVLVRYGLVAMLGAQIVAALLTVLPVTSDVSAWYFTTGLVGVIGAITIASLGLWSAVAGHPAPAWERPQARRSGTLSSR